MGIEHTRRGWAIMAAAGLVFCKGTVCRNVCATKFRDYANENLGTEGGSCCSTASGSSIVGLAPVNVFVDAINT